MDEQSRLVGHSAAGALLAGRAPATLEPHGPAVADRLRDPPPLDRGDPREQSLRVGAMRAGQVRLKAKEEARQVCGRDLIAAPEARRRLEVRHPRTPRDLLESLVADLGVDSVGGMVVRVGDHRFEQRLRRLVERQVVAIEPAELRGQQKSLADAGGAELSIGVVSLKADRVVDDGEGDVPPVRGELLGAPDGPRRRIRIAWPDLVLLVLAAPLIGERTPADAHHEDNRQSGHCDPPRLGAPHAGRLGAGQDSAVASSGSSPASVRASA